MVIFSGNSGYTLYSDPITVNCARSDGDYQVDWEDNKIIITSDDSTKQVNAYVRVADSDGRVVNVISVNGESDLSEYLGKGYDLRLFIWDNRQAPVTRPFER